MLMGERPWNCPSFHLLCGMLGKFFLISSAGVHLWKFTFKKN